MKNIFKIFEKDIHGICKNWVAVIIILGLIVIPSLYAWINILASSDPYGATGGVKVAVVNLDKGGEILGEKILIGNDIMDSLKQNKKLGWIFYESKKKAISDTKKGKVYAAIVIPEDFSAKLCTMLDNPVKPNLEYYVNMKKNAIAPKMTDAGANGLQNQVKESFIDAVVVKVYNKMNDLGAELDKEYDSIEKFKEFLYKADANLPMVGKGINEAKDVSNETLDVINRKESDVRQIEEFLKDAQNVTGSLRGDLEVLDHKITDLEPALFKILDNGQGIAEGAVEGSQNLIDTKKKIDELLGKLTIYNVLVDQIKALIHDIGMEDKVEAEKNKINQINKLILSINETGKEIEILIGEVSQNLRTEDLPKLHNYLKEGEGLADEANWSVNYGIEESEKLLNIMEQVKEIDMQLMGDLEGISSKWPVYEAKINSLISKAKNLDEDIDFGLVIDLLNKDANQEGNFFSSPVELKTHEFFPMKTYGAAMTPFYTTLCLWVGALILCALLSTEAKNANFDFTMKQEFFGKWLLFAFLAMLQGLVVALGDMFILKISVAHPVVFTALAVFYSLVFITIVYTFVAQLGNVGKAVGVILLVVQIAGSGGTFPIEVTPEYFQKIYAVLPFTYGIDGMREAVAGIVPENLKLDLTVLGIYLGAFLLLGLVSKHWIRRITGKLNEKLSESGVTEH